MKKVITLAMIMVITLMLTGCGREKIYNQCTTPNWSDFNANKEYSHVYFAYSENSFYSDGNLTGDMLYEDFMERKTGE